MDDQNTPEPDVAPKMTACRSTEIVEDGAQFIMEGMSAYKKLDGAPEEELFAQLRASQGYIDPTDYDPTDITLYAAAIFELKHRGYDVTTEDGTLTITDEDDDVVYQESFTEDDTDSDSDSELTSAVETDTTP